MPDITPIDRLASSIDGLARGNAELARAYAELTVKYTDTLEKMQDRLGDNSRLLVKLGVLDAGAGESEVSRLQEVEEDYDVEHDQLDQLEALMNSENAPKYDESGRALGLIDRVSHLVLLLKDGARKAGG